MALKRWHQAGIVVAAAALAAAVILPPRPMPDQEDSSWPARLMFTFGFSPFYGRHRHSDLLAGTASELRGRRTAVRLADSLLAQARGPRAVKSADGRAIVVFEPGLSADSARTWLGLLEQELALGPESPSAGMPVILALRSSPEHPRRPRAPGAQESPLPVWYAARLVSWRPERPACVVMIRIASTGPYVVSSSSFLEHDARSGSTRTNVLDWCQAFARFGLPGAGLRRWTGSRLQKDYWGYSNSLADLSRALSLERRHSTREELRARATRDEWPGANPLDQVCAKVGGLQCLRGVGVVVDPSMRYDGFFIALSRRLLLARLMLQDPARFERFWRSDERPEVALSKAYGRPADAIISEWRRSIVDVPSSGPRTPAPTLLSSLGWAALAVGLGLLMAHRRQVSS